ncbi:hypothetical protein HZH66_004794 [Vespula vulgaris]|uniref:Uncharacterized protein n=1 Tax=Vespula vulgaris TaxID=7454 RepID=A0A834NAV2_VESVU|nr:hypothetical protein HZH66_004794 [Vespula vulgaris]
METEAKKRKICEDKHKHYKKRRIKDKNEEYGGKCEKEKRHIKQDENEKKKSRKGRGEEEEFEEEKEGRYVGSCYHGSAVSESPQTAPCSNRSALVQP